MKQLANILEPFGCKVVGVPLTEVLHLKTGVVYLENGVMLTAGEFCTKPAFEGYTKITVPKDEPYAANCIWVNGKVIVPEGYPKVLKAVQAAGYQTLTLSLIHILNRLSGRERQIVIMRYGLSGTQPLTQQQVADILHISSSYVSRIEKKALEELRAMMRKGASAAKG